MPANRPALADDGGYRYAPPILRKCDRILGKCPAQASEEPVASRIAAPARPPVRFPGRDGCRDLGVETRCCLT